MCLICQQDPGSHSFEFYGKSKEGMYMYYTCPAKATRYWDTKGILNHYEEVLYYPIRNFILRGIRICTNTR